MYLDKLDGRIDVAFYERMTEQWRSQQQRFLGDISRHQQADRSYLEQGIALLELAQTSRELFLKREPGEKRHLLNFVLSNATWMRGELSAAYRQPFDIIAETTALASNAAAGAGQIPPGHPVWLGD